MLVSSQVNPIKQAGIATTNKEKKEDIRQEKEKQQLSATKLPTNITLQEQLERMQLSEAREDEDEEADEQEAEKVDAETDEGFHHLSLFISVVFIRSVN